MVGCGGAGSVAGGRGGALAGGGAGDGTVAFPSLKETAVVYSEVLS